jgi:hypothetical protein
LQFSILKLDNVTDPNKIYAKELAKLFAKGEDHVQSNHIRQFSRETPNRIIGSVDPSYGGVKTKGTATKSYSVWVRCKLNVFKC